MISILKPQTFITPTFESTVHEVFTVPGVSDKFYGKM